MSQAEDLISDFYREFDLGIETDLFDCFFLNDSLRGCISPSFTKVDDLDMWVLEHLANLREDLF